MNKDLLSENDLLTKLDNLSRKYSINVIIENREEKMPHSIGYDTNENVVIANIPKFLDLVRKQRFIKFSDVEHFIDAKFLHEYHHSRIKRKCKKPLWLLNFCEDYYIDNILMRDNEALMRENLICKEILSTRIDDDKINIMITDLETIFLLCSNYCEDELKKIYGDKIINYKKIFENIKCENDICIALTELKKLYEDTEDSNLDIKNYFEGMNNGS